MTSDTCLDSSVGKALDSDAKGWGFKSCSGGFFFFFFFLLKCYFYLFLLIFDCFYVVCFFFFFFFFKFCLLNGIILLPVLIF